MAYKDSRLEEANSGNSNKVFDEEYQERSLRLGTISRVYEQADRVLSGDPVQVHVVDSGPAPGWSDGESIWLNASMINRFDLEELTQVNGVNFHELAHHLYSPRRNTELVKYVIKNSYLTAFNILEDQRIETLLTGRYPAIAPFLAASVIRWLGSDESVCVNYIAVTGRKYLPVKVREAFRDQFIRPDLIPTVRRIVGEYRLLAFNRDFKRAMELIKEFHEKVIAPMQIDSEQPGSGSPGPMDVPGGPGMCGQRNPLGKGRPEPSKSQERDAGRARGIGKDETPYTPKQQPDESSEGEAGQANPPAASESEGSGSNTNNSSNNIPSEYVANTDYSYSSGETVEVDITREEAERLRESRVGQDASFTSGNAHHKSVGGKPADESIGALKEALSTSLAEIYADKSVQRDVRNKQRVIIGNDKYDENNLKMGKYDNIPASPAVVSSYRRFARELERIKQDNEPAWNREQPSGKINVQRIISGCEVDKAFDRWEEGNDATDIEAVLLVDRSGSMGGGNDTMASEALWVIKRSLDHVNADVTAYAFDHQAEVVWNRNTKTKPTSLPFIFGNGGTDPHSALVAAERVFMTSRRSSKILFIITDGQFDSKGDEIIQRLNKSGVLTVMVLIMRDRDWTTHTKRVEEYRKAGHDVSNMSEFRHGCQVFNRVDNGGNLVAIARSVVTQTMKGKR